MSALRVLLEDVDQGHSENMTGQSGTDCLSHGQMDLDSSNGPKAAGFLHLAHEACDSHFPYLPLLVPFYFNQSK
jgi:hypothetical protein